MSDKKEIGFVRKHPLSGVYGICYKKRQIQIKDREIFFTNDNGLIKALRSDPEISEFKPEPKAREIVEYSKMSEKDLLKICKKCGLANEKLKVEDTSKEAMIKALESYDKENSASKNDQGEQNPE